MYSWVGICRSSLAARFSLKGFDVTGFDIKEERVIQLKNNIDINNDESIKHLESLNKNSNYPQILMKLKIVMFI